MMLICAWPSSGPTGGAGVALPASICNLTDVCTFFGAICSLFFENLFFLLERRRPRLRESLLSFVAQALLPVLLTQNREPQAPSPANHFFLPEEHLSSQGSLAVLGIKKLCRHFLYLPELKFHRCRAAK